MPHPWGTQSPSQVWEGSMQDNAGDHISSDRELSRILPIVSLDGIGASGTLP